MATARTPARGAAAESGSGLACYASSAERSRGRRHPEPPPRRRGPFQRDRDRIVHSAAFRRLEYKTQVFVNHEGDLFRTRLTHTIEVAQVARSIARALRLNEDLAEAIALAHDLGHPPFGHAGQEALHGCMREYGGFEHNLQSLRVVDELEERYAEFRGLNLSFETREGILKQCPAATAAELGELGQRFLDGTQPSLEAQLVNLADEIAYVCHDLDDGLRARMIEIEQAAAVAQFGDIHAEVCRRYPKLPARRQVHEVIRRLVGHLIGAVIEASEAELARLQPRDADAVRAQPAPLVGYGEARAAVAALKRFLMGSVYRHFRVQRMSAKAAQVIERLFAALLEDPGLLPPAEQERLRHLEALTGDSGRARAVADYIAGMTDRYALLEYRRLFDPVERS